ncbi:MAG: hypothetical protein M3176_10530 [Chloroflexota bacterium]|nr:hypothetical protein [Chloroflexota bacterium]MDQ6907255.1 hypothetical protein [Chloroflexota bacterium]
MPNVEYEDELRTLAAQPVGTTVFVEETRERLIAVGNVPAHIAARLHWTQQNIWLPGHARDYILGRHAIFPDVFAAVQAVLSAPSGIYVSQKRPNCVLFLADAGMLHQRQLLSSDSVPYVDAIIERRVVTGGFYLRCFHLSPATRNKGGLRLWP